MYNSSICIWSQDLIFFFSLMSLIASAYNQSCRNAHRIVMRASKIERCEFGSGRNKTFPFIYHDYFGTHFVFFFRFLSKFRTSNQSSCFSFFVFNNSSTMLQKTRIIQTQKFLKKKKSKAFLNDVPGDSTIIIMFLYKERMYTHVIVLFVDSLIK